MKSLYITLISTSDNTFKINADYKFFICKVLRTVQNFANRETCDKELFLTYEDMIRVLLNLNQD